ncbi:hypothetical protein [Streptomyces sp. NPDC006309]|uniref:hypothetical protein n=1 Tax=Streptomyces sp. NPDC006309 TaxID=3156749 RepID=UPI0033AA5C01
MDARPQRALGAAPVVGAALLITVVRASAATPDRPCGGAAPCGADRLGMTETGLSAGLLYWLVRLPELALTAAPVLAVVVARVRTAR